MENGFIYAVTRVHNREQTLLTSGDVERLIAAQDEAACLAILKEKGWGANAAAAEDADALLSYETEKTWALLEELAGKLTPFFTLYHANDYHNLKAAIKLAYRDESPESAPRYFMRPASIAPETVLAAVCSHRFDVLPPAMAEAGRNAYEVLLHTEDAQASDMILDAAALKAVEAAAAQSQSELMRFYALLKADEANIKAAVRACRMGRARDFLERAVAEAGSLDRGALIGAAAASLEALYAFLRTTEYAGATDALKESLSAFERWCADRLMQEISPERHRYFTIEPLVAYLLWRENEIAMARLILSAKRNGLGEAAVRKRMRQMYV